MNISNKEVYVFSIYFLLQIIRYICECVSTRAAVLAAAGIAALLNKMARKK